MDIVTFVVIWYIHWFLILILSIYLYVQLSTSCQSAVLLKLVCSYGISDLKVGEQEVSNTLFKWNVHLWWKIAKCQEGLRRRWAFRPGKFVTVTLCWSWICYLWHCTIHQLHIFVSITIDSVYPCVFSWYLYISLPFLSKNVRTLPINLQIYILHSKLNIEAWYI